MTEIRIPPQNLSAEKSVLGCQMLDNRAIDDVREVLSPGDFYADVHGTIQQAILKLRDGGSAVDAVTLAEQLTRAGSLGDIGGIPYLLDVLETVPHAVHAVYYARIVASCARRRKAIQIGQRLVEAAWDPTNEESELSEAAAAAASSLADQNISAARLITMSEAVASLIDSFEQGILPTANVFIPEIDALTRGTAAGEMLVVGARPSHGKSLFAVQSLDCAALNGLPGLIVSEEMSVLSLAGRMLQTATPLESDFWIQDTSRLRRDAADHFAGRAPVYIAEKCGSIGAVERAVEKAVRNHAIKVLAVDYAQLIKGAGDNEQERIADVSQRIKALTVKHDLRTLLLAQLNRGIESRENPEPELSDLRGSGSLEQDGDVILFPFWPYKLNSKYENPLEFRIYCRKNRNRGIPQALTLMRINPKRQLLESAPDEDLQRILDWECSDGHQDR